MANRISLAVTVSILGLLAGSVPGAGLVGLAQAPAGIPRTADGKPDFSGIWQTLSAAEFDLEPHAARKDAPPGPGIVEGGVIPYRPAASGQRGEELRGQQHRGPATEVLHAGHAAGIYYPEPFQIFQRRAT